MTDNAVELINANDWLESTFEERERLIDLAPKIFALLYDFFEGDPQDDTDDWIVKMYWEIVKKRTEGFAIEIRDAKQDGSDYSAAEEFKALKWDTTACLRKKYGMDIRDIWKRLEEEE